MATWLRETIPELYNKYYNNGSGNYSDCVTGYSSKYPNGFPGLNTLPNCVGLAWGAFNETYVNTTGASPGFHYRIYGDANTIYDQAKALGWQTLTPEQTPPLGGLVLWGGDGGGHVAYVSDVADKDNITIHESAYNITYSHPSLSNAIYDVWRIRSAQRNANGTNKWGAQNSSYFCQGYIINPAIPYPPVTTKPPEILGIAQTSSTNVQVVGNINGSEGNVNTLLLYINWDKDSVSTTDYYEIAQQAGTGEFEINIKKPRKAKKIAVLPVRHENQSTIEGEMVVEPLTASGPCIYIYNKGKIIQSIPYIYHNNKWVEAIPNIYTKNKWEEIYNTIG